MRPLLALAAVLGAASAAHAAEAARDRVRIVAEVSADLERIAGETVAVLVNDTGAPLEAVTVWLYPEVFADVPAGVSPKNREYFEPYLDARGGMELLAATAGGVPVVPVPAEAEGVPEGTARVLPLPAPVPPGGAVTVALRFRTRVPERLGPLTRAHGALTAFGGWHPYVTAGDVRARSATERLPRPALHEVVVAPPPGTIALVGQTRVAPGRPVRIAGQFVPLWVRPGWLDPLPTRGGRVWPLSRPPPPPDGCDFPDPPPLANEWIADDLATLLARLDAWADVGGRVPGTGPVDLFLVPLGAELALATGGGVAVSERFYAIPPIAQVRALHDRAVARAYFAERLLPLVRAREEPGDVPLVADALGAWLAARFVEEAEGRAADLPGLLAVLDFVPSLDDFIRSPKSAFSHVYFQPVAEPIAVRDEPATFATAGPRGKLLLEKTIDWIGEPAVARAIAHYLEAGPRGPTLLDALEAIAGEDLDAFYRAWTETFPREDLRVRIEDRREEDGAHLATVVIERLGDAPPEVIEAEVTAGGGPYALVWRAAAGEHSRAIEVRTGSPIERVRVDPRGRVTQVAFTPGELPSLGDVVPSRVQVLLSRFGLTYSTVDGTVYGDADVTFRRRDVVRRRLSVGGSVRPARIGARSVLSFGFGPLVDATRYAASFGFGLEGDYLRGGFADGAADAGWTLGPTVGVVYDDRPPVPEPESGTAYGAGGGLSLGSTLGGDAVAYSTLTAGTSHLEPVGKGHVFALRLRGSLIVGSPPFQELLPLGGGDGLRGFALEEVLGERILLAGAEWRFPLARRLDENLLVGYLRSVGGVAFVEGAAVGGIQRQEVPGVTTPESALLGSAGLGLRFQYDFLGVQPLVVGVDGAVPLGRLEGENRPPVAVLLRAGQAFASP